MSLLKHIQESDGATKRIVGAALLILSVTVLVIVWRAYLDTILDAADGKEAAAEVSVSEFSFWQSAKGGIMRRIQGMFDKEYEITP